MPVVYRCSRCGFLLYVFCDPPRQPLPTPSYVVELYGGVCPRCGKPLRVPRDPIRDMSIRPWRGGRLEPTRNVLVAYRGYRVPSTRLRAALPRVLWMRREEVERLARAAPCRVATVKLPTNLWELVRERARELRLDPGTILRAASTLAAGVG